MEKWKNIPGYPGYMVFNLKPYIVKSRLALVWPIAKALTTPVEIYRKTLQNENQ